VIGFGSKKVKPEAVSSSRNSIAATSIDFRPQHQDKSQRHYLGQGSCLTFWKHASPEMHYHTELGRSGSNDMTARGGGESDEVLMEWKKRSEETQTLRGAGCSKAEPKLFDPPQTPFPGARDGQNLISWRWSLPLPKNPVWWGSMHANSSYRGNRPTHPPHTHKHTHTETWPITIHCAAASVQCNDVEIHIKVENDNQCGNQ